MLPFLFVHVFAYGGDGLGAISRVCAGSIDLVLEPGTLRQTFFVQEQARDAKQIGVHRVERLAEKLSQPLLLNLASALE